MAICTSESGTFYLSIERIHGDDFVRLFVKEYHFSEMGLHFFDGVKQVFVPHQNISSADIEPYDGGGWK